MNFRGLYKWAGVCAIGYAVVSLAAYLISLAANGAVSVTPPNPDQIWDALQRQGTHIASRLDQLSYFLWIPALVGLFAYLRDRRPGRAHLGGAFAAFAVVGFFAASALGSSMLDLPRQPVSQALKERLALFDLVSFALLLPALYAIAVSNLLWGLALRTQAGLARTAGSLFLAQVVAFVIADAGFIGKQSVILNAGILLNGLALAASYLCAGLLLGRAAKGEIEAKASAQEKPLVAGASA
ncbi:MAG: hypothetical protein DMG06_00395 [Acidobacteria bacterium]|nr:MAG: hypothetical protein DMG06_00395 [Acidobacteriota bacterium]